MIKYFVFMLVAFATSLMVLTLTPKASAAQMALSVRQVSCAATFSATGTACATTVTDTPMKQFALQEYLSFDSSTTYTVILEGSLDGVNYTTLLTETNATPNATTWSTTASPVRFLRLRASALAANKTFSARFQAMQ